MSKPKHTKAQHTKAKHTVPRRTLPATSVAARRGHDSAGTTAAAIRPRDPQRLSQLAGEVALREFSAHQREQWRREIHEQMLMTSRSIDGPNFRKIGRDDVARMIRMYDDRYFGGKILPTATAEGVSFGISSRMTSVAGKLVTQYPEGKYDGIRSFELVLSSTLLFQTFEDVSRPVEVAGCLCRDRLEAMQRIAEHELVHLVEMLIWNDGNCSEARFQSIAKRYFGHTDYQHNLITQRERAAVRFNIRVGDHVAFHHDGHRLQGRVNRITRRATVLVPNSAGERFSDGHRYVRFYVPLDRLQRVVP
ncbi:hypothetical protein FYK55_20735 [Roseiconus nitratireducens]|uniref:SprT-like family protein n=1 Tax=Roseiconus nitratireducens TaxID=2605748 RepID=A0A5M6D1C6_9BACT|nr:hypothetical protein [Roseiconus nitratireducens]KAA5540440.1 hypothetical protein FYK55_20735 [Roseiconus nitratireducens]